jgi:hypothetical protein
MRVEKKHLVTGALLAFVAVTAGTLAVKETGHARAVAAAEATRGPGAAVAESPAPAEPPATIIVTYFHTTARCASCLKIEDLTDATMTTRFAGPVAEKRIVWRSLNLDEPANAHFVKDYGLYTKSVVVAEVKEGREVRWKNLDQVWHLLGNPESFQAYVEKEVQGFLDPA